MFIQELQDYHGKTIFKESAWSNRVEGEEKNFSKILKGFTSRNEKAQEKSKHTHREW